MESPIENGAAAETPDDKNAASAENLGAALPRPRTRAENVPSEEQVRAAALAALDRKAHDLRVLDVARTCDFTDFFIICSGTNERQVAAIADAMLEACFKLGVKPLHVEGQTNARWVLLDFGGDFVAHVFLEEARRFYELERLWSDAKDRTAQLAVETPR